MLCVCAVVLWRSVGDSRDTVALECRWLVECWLVMAWFCCVMRLCCGAVAFGR